MSHRHLNYLIFQKKKTPEVNRRYEIGRPDPISIYLVMENAHLTHFLRWLGSF